jgi:hypothetical protein
MRNTHRGIFNLVATARTRHTDFQTTNSLPNRHSEGNMSACFQPKKPRLVAPGASMEC